MGGRCTASPDGLWPVRTRPPPAKREKPAPPTSVPTVYRAPPNERGNVPPQPPCEISAAHFKVNGGVLHLKTAAEKPDQRNGQLAEAHRVQIGRASCRERV